MSGISFLVCPIMIRLAELEVMMGHTLNLPLKLPPEEKLSLVGDFNE